jgi:hypothetical protein
LKLATVVTNPCEPSPCGPFSQCRVINGDQSICSCQPGYIGSPPSCRPQCVSDSDCELTKACSNSKCTDVCLGACGRNSICDAKNHRAYCRCEKGFIGDPFTSCQREPYEDPPKPVNPCSPSPCGPNSICRDINSQAVCSCVPDMLGNPPNCRPECTDNSECPSKQYNCINQKCRNICEGSCGQNAVCNPVNSIATCSCYANYTGDPFTYCSPILYRKIFLNQNF